MSDPAEQPENIARDWFDKRFHEVFEMCESNEPDDDLNDYRSPPFERAGTRQVGMLIPDGSDISELVIEVNTFPSRDAVIVKTREPESEMTIQERLMPHETQTRQLVGIPIERLRRARHLIAGMADCSRQEGTAFPYWAQIMIAELRDILGKPS